MYTFGLNGGLPPRRVTFGGNSSTPVWTPDGKRVTFASDRSPGAGIYWQPADGTGAAERLIPEEPGQSIRPEAWTFDGKTLAFIKGAGGGGDIWTLTPGSWTPAKLVEFPGNQRYTEFSRDARWFAYATSEAGNNFDIFVQPYPPTGSKSQITSKSARTPLWSKDGKELYYIEPENANGRIVIADVTTTPSFSVGKSVTIAVPGAEFTGEGRQYDVTPDGKQFVVLLSSADGKGPAKPAPSQINIVLNWIEELKQKVPVK